MVMGHNRRPSLNDHCSISFLPDLKFNIDISTPLDSLLLIFDEEIFDEIQYETNLKRILKKN